MDRRDFGVHGALKKFCWWGERVSDLPRGGLGGLLVNRMLSRKRVRGKEVEQTKKLSAVMARGGVVEKNKVSGKKNLPPLSISANPLQDDPKNTLNPAIKGSSEAVRPVADVAARLSGKVLRGPRGTVRAAELPRRRGAH